MYYEAGAVARELDPSWNCRSKELMTLYAKAKQYEAGEKVEFGGRKYAPLYTPKNDTLISLFEITDDEQRKLRTLISRDMAAERHRKRDEARRRVYRKNKRPVSWFFLAQRAWVPPITLPSAPVHHGWRGTRTAPQQAACLQ